MIRAVKSKDVHQEELSLGQTMLMSGTRGNYYESKNSIVKKREENTYVYYLQEGSGNRGSVCKVINSLGGKVLELTSNVQSTNLQTLSEPEEMVPEFSN